jgi:predicted ATPase
MAVATGEIMRCAARAMLDPSDGLVAEIRQALAAYRATGARFQSTHHVILLAQALAARGRCDEALAAVAEAATLVAETGERYLEAEVHRLGAVFLLAQTANASAEAEVRYSKALKIARSQEARSLELRAACDLARLWAGAGERRKATDLLVPVYGWFTEGLHTADLEDAKALIDQLG